jgi:hypothetical protein
MNRIALVLLSIFVFTAPGAWAGRDQAQIVEQQRILATLQAERAAQRGSTSAPRVAICWHPRTHTLVVR